MNTLMARKALIPKEPPTPIEPPTPTPSPKEIELPAEETEAVAVDDSPNAIRWILSQPAGYPAGLVSPSDIALRPGDIIGLGAPVGNESRYIFEEKGAALVRCGFAAFLYVATSPNDGFDSKEG